jgi:hypothetical protein
MNLEPYASLSVLLILSSLRSNRMDVFADSKECFLALLKTGLMISVKYELI